MMRISSLSSCRVQCHGFTLVQTVITWREGDRIWRTRGLDADQTEAAIKATLKMINMYEADKSDEQAVSPRNLDME